MIEKVRARLHEMINQLDNDTFNDEIIALSQYLDDLILVYEKIAGTGKEGNEDEGK